MRDGRAGRGDGCLAPSTSLVTGLAEHLTGEARATFCNADASLHPVCAECREASACGFLSGS